MSKRIRRKRAAAEPSPATIFAALGDETRLLIVRRLSDGEALSISRLTSGSRLTRQAITKHLEILKQAKLVRSTRRGREKQFALAPEPLDEMKQYLARVSLQWDTALARLRSFVET